MIVRVNSVQATPVNMGDVFLEALKATKEQVVAHEEAGHPLSGVSALDMVGAVVRNMSQILGLASDVSLSAQAFQKPAKVRKTRSAPAIQPVEAVITVKAKRAKGVKQVRAKRVKQVKGPVAVEMQADNADKVAARLKERERGRARRAVLNIGSKASTPFDGLSIDAMGADATLPPLRGRRPNGLVEGLVFKAPATDQVPAVDTRLSAFYDRLICLEDGQVYKMLQRPLKTHFQMTMDEYKAKWGLPDNYPATTPAHSEGQRELAKKLGFGHRTREWREAKGTLGKRVVEKQTIDA